MEDFTTFFFILICASDFYVYLENKASDVTYVSLNNVEFLVRNLPDKEEAALLLSNIVDRLTKLVEHCCENIVEDKEEIDKLDETQKIHNDSLKRMKKNFKPNNITESSFLNNHYTPLVTSLQETITNPVNLVEGVAHENWVRGGVPSRELTKDGDNYMSSMKMREYQES